MVWDVTRDLLSMREQLDSLAGRSTGGWMPAADLQESPDRFVLTLEVPGVAREDIHIDFRDGQLEVSGRRPDGTCPQRYQQIERGHGTFARVFSFGRSVDGGGATAELANGLLTITIPKTHDATARRINIE